MTADHLQTVVCPHCKNEFAVGEALTHHFEEALQRKLLASKKEIENAFQQRVQALEQKEQQFEAFKQKEKEHFYDRLEKEKQKLSEQIAQRIESRHQEQINKQNLEMDALNKQVAQLKDREIELQKLRRQMELQEKDLELKYEAQLLEKQSQIEESISKRIYQEVELKMKEKDKQLDDQKKMLTEMQRKAEQGSMQLQGAVQEMAIESWLKTHFPFDDIDEIKTGARGGDCKQMVHTRQRKNCGTIYYESKRTKEFHPSWLDKFKQDMIRHNADIGVIVTQAMPKDMDRMGEKNGIWICTYEEFKSLAFILRQMLIKLHEVADHERNKGDKMTLLYSYLTSNEFKMKIETIVEGFTQMQDDLTREKNAMFRIWSQREKQIQKVLINTTEMYGDIKGIAGKEIPNVRQLELPIDEGDEVFDLDKESTLFPDS